MKVPQPNTLNTDVTRLYGVGKVRAANYARLGIRTVKDLLEHYPRGYENRGDVRPLCETDPEGKSSVLLTVAAEPKVARLKKRMTLVKFKAYDESGVCEITFFNQEYLKNCFPVGAKFRFYGRVQRTKSGYSMSSPAYEAYSADTELPPLMPVYSLTEGLNQKQVSKDVKAAMVIVAYADAEEEVLPEAIRLRNSLCLRSYALRNIHCPDSFKALLEKLEKQSNF